MKTSVTRTFESTLFSVAKIIPEFVRMPTAAPAWLMASTAYSTYKSETKINYSRYFIT